MLRRVASIELGFLYPDTSTGFSQVSRIICPIGISKKIYDDVVSKTSKIRRRHFVLCAYVFFFCLGSVCMCVVCTREQIHRPSYRIHRESECNKMCNHHRHTLCRCNDTVDEMHRVQVQCRMPNEIRIRRTIDENQVFGYRPTTVV